MPFTVERDLARRWLRARGGGTLSIDSVTEFIRTVRAPLEMRTWPLLVDARSCCTSITPADVEQAVELVRQVVNEQRQHRAHAALVADDDELYARFLEYEARCSDLGVRRIRVFRRIEDAEHWLEIVSAARELS